MVIAETPWHSWKAGSLCEGCKLCVEGKKLVLFITGLCAQRCFYCPVSEHKFGHDSVYANEWKVENPHDPKELLEEAKLTGAKGAGITGGDPLVQIDRCVEYIKLLKKTFGKSFHIHLYTPLKLVTKERLQKLFGAGLDEIRFHPNLDDESLWDRVSLGREFAWKVGIEIPTVPGYEEKIAKLIDFVADKVDFINLNELELSDTAAEHYKLHDLGFKQKDELSYGVKDSAELAKKMVAYAQKKGLSAHFCTAKLKDSVQVRQRLIARAKRVALPFDEQTPDGTLVRGIVYLPELTPRAKYTALLKSVKKDETVKKLQDLLPQVLGVGFKSDEVVIDDKKYRFIIPHKMIAYRAKAIKKLGLIPALVEEYPTSDGLEVEVDFL